MFVCPWSAPMRRNSGEAETAYQHQGENRTPTQSPADGDSCRRLNQESEGEGYFIGELRSAPKSRASAWLDGDHGYRLQDRGYGRDEAQVGIRQEI